MRSIVIDVRFLLTHMPSACQPSPTTPLGEQDGLRPTLPSTPRHPRATSPRGREHRVAAQPGAFPALWDHAQLGGRSLVRSSVGFELA